ncbi:MAG TPA: hypothetical protein VEV17_17490 [Bryobacteraceae bacterium]|nr:hypothetical protein [Bryobacteraceae bacterium]
MLLNSEIKVKTLLARDWRSRLSNRWLGLAICTWMTFAMGGAWAQVLGPNQTNGFGNGRLVTFTYLQNFDCVDQPFLDLDFNHIKAQSDPNEMQIPICQAVTEPSQDPAGGDIKHTAHLYVLVPMFSVDDDQNPDDAMECPFVRTNELCGHALGMALINRFHFLPEAWKKNVNPAITTQCPDPGNPVAGTCTMHASSVDLSVLLANPGTTPTTPIFVPTPNHSHVIDNSRVNSGAIWWEVRPVLVLHQSDWPSADGTSGITSAKIMDEAEAAGRAMEVGSNFFLFFSSEQSSMGAAMQHMHANTVAAGGGQ